MAESSSYKDSMIDFLIIILFEFINYKGSEKVKVKK